MLYQDKHSKSSYKNSTKGIKYTSKDYSNPFFNNKRKGRSGFNFYISVKVKLIFSFSILLLLLLLIFLVYSPVFAIKNINISGQGKIDEENIRKIADEYLNYRFYRFIPMNNIFIFSKNRFKTNLEEKFVFKELDITMNLPSTLNISYTEEKYAIIYEEGEKYFYVDDSGNVIEEVNVLEINEKEYPILKNDSGRNTEDKKLQVGQEIIKYTIDSFQAFKDSNVDFAIAYFQINADEANSYWLVVKDGPKIYLDTKSSFEKQLEKLVVIKNQKLKDNFFEKEYIDLRFGDSIYFR